MEEWTYVECSSPRCCGLDHDGGYRTDPATGEQTLRPCSPVCPHCGCVGQLVTMLIAPGSMGPILVRQRAFVPPPAIDQDEEGPS